MRCNTLEILSGILIVISGASIMAFMTNTPDFSKLRALLDDQYNWPQSYTFKFICKQSTLEVVSQHFEGHEITTNNSRTGKYTSITIHKHVESSDQVIDTYKLIGSIEGVIAL